MREPGPSNSASRRHVAALKAGDKRRREALRSTRGAQEGAHRRRKEPTEADELAVLKRERKRRLEALEVYESAGREDLAEQERYEEGLIAGYMPEELGDAELDTLVDEAIAATGAVTPRDMGKVMGWLKQVAGRADGKALSDLVREKARG